MVELRVPDRMAVLPVVMVVVMALLVVPQAKAQAVELAQMAVIPALVLLTDPEAQVVQQMVAQVTALATEQVLETAAMVAQEAEMAAAVEMEELAAEMALATVAPTLTHQP